MIIGRFKLGGDITVIIIKQNDILFQDLGTGTTAPLQGLKLNKDGVIKEHPDLKDNPDWRKISIERLRKHIAEYKTELDRLIYVKDELRKFGYTEMSYQRAGHRPKKFTQ